MSVEASLVTPQGTFEAAERGEQIVPCPLVPRERPTYSSDPAFAKAGSTIGVPSNAVSVAAPGEAAWVAVHAGVGPAKLLVSWACASRGSGSAIAPAPSAYVIETSASSANGRDGEWRHELSVDANTASARTHVVEFDGQSWLRLTLADVPVGSTLPFERLDLHDVSDGTDDCWLVLGDAHFAALAHTPLATDRVELCWAELIHDGYPGYFPALVDETRIDESPARTLERLNQLLAAHSAVRRVAIAYRAASVQSIDADAGALEAMVAMLLRGGRLPVVARQPAMRGQARDTVDAFNRRVAAVERRHGLQPGPDLAAWFDAHPEQLESEGQPSVEGRRAIARLWADAVDAWYVPQ
jgi:hypothetical protein